MRFRSALHDLLNEQDREVVHETVAAFVNASVAPAPAHG
jgi:hypothetical protein